MWSLQGSFVTCGAQTTRFLENWGVLPPWNSLSGSLDPLLVAVNSLDAICYSWGLISGCIVITHPTVRLLPVMNLIYMNRLFVNRPVGQMWYVIRRISKDFGKIYIFRLSPTGNSRVNGNKLAHELIRSLPKIECTSRNRILGGTTSLTDSLQNRSWVGGPFLTACTGWSILRASFEIKNKLFPVSLPSTIFHSFF